MRKLFSACLSCFAIVCACSNHVELPSTVIAMPFAASSPEITRHGIAASWEHARVYLPYSTQAAALGNIPKDARYPAVLFMHGCWGFDSEEHRNWAILLASLGFLVIMPDSLARPKRIARSCDRIDNYHRSSYLPVHEMRLAEIDYASGQIRQQPWFDEKNLFLMGYSEGAIAVVRTSLHGFNGVIATSWTCTHLTYPPLHGIQLPLETPLLTIAVDGDPWFPTKDLQGSCEDRMMGRANAKHLGLPGQSSFVRLMKRAGRKFFDIPIDHRENHSTSDNEKARQAVIQFIQRHRRGT